MWFLELTVSGFFWVANAWCYGTMCKCWLAMNEFRFFRLIKCNFVMKLTQELKLMLREIMRYDCFGKFAIFVRKKWQSRSFVHLINKAKTEKKEFIGFLKFLQLKWLIQSINARKFVHFFFILQTKGTSSFGKRHNKTHTLCRRCGRSSYHIQKSTCAHCGYPAAKIRSCK